MLATTCRKDGVAALEGAQMGDAEIVYRWKKGRRWAMQRSCTGGRRGADGRWRGRGADGSVGARIGGGTLIRHGAERWRSGGVDKLSKKS